MMGAPATILLWKDPAKNQAPAPELCCYLLPGKMKRPAVLVIPGGGYGGVCEATEGEPIARKFNELGFHALSCITVWRRTVFRNRRRMCSAPSG